MRRNNWSVKRAANFSIMCLRTQLENTRELNGVTGADLRISGSEPNEGVSENRHNLCRN